MIEVDGSQHAETAHAEKDAERDAYLKSQDFRVLRIWNSDIDDNFDRVMSVILQALEEL